MQSFLLINTRGIYFGPGRQEESFISLVMAATTK
jgi:hypothetical protein